MSDVQRPGRPAAAVTLPLSLLLALAVAACSQPAGGVEGSPSGDVAPPSAPASVAPSGDGSSPAPADDGGPDDYGAGSGY